MPVISNEILGDERFDGTWRALCSRFGIKSIRSAPVKEPEGLAVGSFVLTRPFPFVVVGSPDYRRTRKRPERIEDLRQHACLRLRRSNGSIAPWSFANGNKAVEVIVAGPIIANDFPTLLGAAIEGVGLAQVPEPVAAAMVKGGRLARVLERFAPTLPGVFLYYPGRRQIMPKLRAFIDHVKSRFDTGAGSGRPRKRG